MPQIQPSGRGLLSSPTAWSPGEHPAAMLAEVSRYILGRTWSVIWSACPHSHREVSRMPILFIWAGYSGLLGPLQSPNWVKACLVSTVSFLPVSIEPRVEKCLGLSVWDRILSAVPDCRFVYVCLLFRFLSVLHQQAPTGGILKTELSARQGRSTSPGLSGLDQLSWGLKGWQGVSEDGGVCHLPPPPPPLSLSLSF